MKKENIEDDETTKILITVFFMSIIPAVNTVTLIAFIIIYITEDKYD